MRMKDQFLLSVVLIFVIALSIALFMKASYEAPELIDVFICDNASDSHLMRLGLELRNGLLCEDFDNLTPLEAMITYLEKQEKSPPSCA